MTAINLLGTPRIGAASTASGAAVAATSNVDTKPNYAAIYSSTIFAMAVLFFFGVGVPAAMAYGNATGWALGAFSAFWGGPSFGVMAASARVSAWEEKHAAHD